MVLIWSKNSLNRKISYFWNILNRKKIQKLIKSSCKSKKSWENWSTINTKLALVQNHCFTYLKWLSSCNWKSIFRQPFSWVSEIRPGLCGRTQRMVFLKSNLVLWPRMISISLLWHICYPFLSSRFQKDVATLYLAQSDCKPQKKPCFVRDMFSKQLLDILVVTAPSAYTTASVL